MDQLASPDERGDDQVGGWNAWVGEYVGIEQPVLLFETAANGIVETVPYGADNQYDNRAFEYTKNVVDTVYATNRFDPPYDLMVLGC